MSSAQLRKVIIRLAVEVDPLGARLNELARALEVHPRTICGWVADGRVTPVRARDINRKFGDVLAPLSVLTGRKR